MRRLSDLLVATLRSLATALCCLAVLVFVFIGLVPQSGLYRPMTVLSGSMRPAFSPGDLTIVTPGPAERVQVGDVIAFNIPVGDHRVESHRVIQVMRRKPLVVRTKGDANDAADPWTLELHNTTVWKVRLTVPKLGWPIHWLREPPLRWPLVLLAPAAVAAILIRRIWLEPDLDPEHGARARA